jgi:hypothetical protein
MENIIEITGREVLAIKLNKSNQIFKNGAKLKGTKFNSYSYDGKPFNVREDDEFIELQKNGTLFSARFKPTTYEVEINKDGELVTITRESLELVGCTSASQEINMAKTLSVLNRIAKDADIPEMDDALVSALEQEA